MKKFSTRTMVFIGMMAALSCVATLFLKVEIPTPLGKTMFHFGDVFCLSAAMLFGPIGGGLAGGIGMALADLLGGWADSSLTTLLFKFLEGVICGLIAYSGHRCGRKLGFNIAGAAAGTVAYIALYLGKSFVKAVWLLHTEVGTALTDCSVKLLNSSIKGVVSVVVAVALTALLQKALREKLS